jgi:hypothetical protein
MIGVHRGREERKYKDIMVDGNKERLKESISILLFLDAHVV